MPAESPVTLGPETPSVPKVFISYSWTTPGHQEQVRLWAERLMSDGIGVVIDVFDLKEGHDKYHFMERMVTDPAITHVLVMCDRRYSEKANAKKAGVGTESQIISSEVYGKVEQSKFIPIVCEFTADGEPTLPVFLQSRIWLDFSSPEMTNQNWEKLVRLLYGKPAYSKPTVGKAPAYITSEAATVASPLLGKYSTFRQAFISNTKMLKLYRDEFLSACIDYAETFRIREDPGLDDLTFANKVLQDCSHLKVVRNQIVDWVLLESGPEATAEFQEALLSILEKLVELKFRAETMNNWNDSWFEANALFVYETVLYVIAALLKTGSYHVIREVITSHYLKPKAERYGDSSFCDFSIFYAQSGLLQLVLAPEGPRLYSPAGELIKRQADRADLPFPAVIEAELLIFLMALTSSELYWYPQTLLYKAQLDFPFFVRATQHRHYLKLAIITGIPDAATLREKGKEGYARLQVNHWHDFSRSSRSFWEPLNIEKLDTLP